MFFIFVLDLHALMHFGIKLTMGNIDWKRASIVLWEIKES
jgi:hypothetical protein